LKAIRHNTSIKGRTLLGALFALALGALHAPVANAEPAVTPQMVSAFQAADEDHRVHILIKLAQGGFPNAAEQMLHQFPLTGPLAPNRTLYLEGLIAEQRGQFTAAAGKFRAALASDPHLTLVRAELAKVLARLDENDSAKHHLQLLAADTQDPQQLAGINAFMKSLDDHRPFTWSGFVSLAPSTNINQGSSQSTFTSNGSFLPDGTDPVGTILNQAQSGIGITGGLSMTYRHHVADSTEAVASANAALTYYPMVQAASLSTGQALEIHHLMDDGYYGIGFAVGETTDPVNRNLSYLSYGPRLSLLKQVNAQNQLQLNGGYEWRTYYDSPATDGTALSLSGVLTHAFDSTSNLALIAGYEDVTQQLLYNSYHDGTLGLGFYREMPHGFTLEGQGLARYARFEDIYPGKSEARNDLNLTGSLTLTKRDWNLLGFAPSLNYTYVRNFSNVELFDFDSHSLDLRLTKNF
jgi:hypothetical protein